MEGLDTAIAPLVEAMNRVPFIATLSSCGGHPEESSVREYGYAVANVVFDLKDEAENAIRWFGMVQDVLRARKAERPRREHAFIFAKKFCLNLDGYLTWQWDLKIQATGKSPAECRAGLDDGIAFLTSYFNKAGGNYE